MLQERNQDPGPRWLLLESCPAGEGTQDSGKEGQTLEMRVSSCCSHTASGLHSLLQEVGLDLPRLVLP